ncbi:hypothetical protein EDB81DRAFT_399171 [Dactylonectria macrodidyma]|uniref:Uncharacterized protein n=1 Tax=Dactylonectria macrodidyma TaxID=307937 RepID=A0A9P9FAC0_9HYPO|nr:hypothetical protein EDB81DRAFT_399171 [Dactylonectria macrodidyma]
MTPAACYIPVRTREAAEYETVTDRDEHLPSAIDAEFHAQARRSEIDFSTQTHWRKWHGYMVVQAIASSEDGQIAHVLKWRHDNELGHITACAAGSLSMLGNYITAPSIRILGNWYSKQDARSAVDMHQNDRADEMPSFCDDKQEFVAQELLAATYKLSFLIWPAQCEADSRIFNSLIGFSETAVCATYDQLIKLPDMHFLRLANHCAWLGGHEPKPIFCIGGNCTESLRVPSIWQRSSQVMV